MDKKQPVKVEKKEVKNITIYDAELIFKNFRGEKSTWNQSGMRKFSVIIPPNLANDLIKEGWHVRSLKSREQGEPDKFVLEVKINFGYKAPVVKIITSRGESKPLREDQLDMLDWADIVKCDLTIRPYQWTARGDSGIAAYLKTMYVTIEEDELDKKYEQYNQPEEPKDIPEEKEV